MSALTHEQNEAFPTSDLHRTSFRRYHLKKQGTNIESLQLYGGLRRDYYDLDL